MIKKYALLLLLLSSWMTNGYKIEVEYDAEKDIIVKDGKIYLAKVSPRLLQNESSEANPPSHKLTESQKEHLKESNFHNTEEACHHEEEQVSGGRFWFYIAAILCNNINIKFYTHTRQLKLKFFLNT